MLKQTLITIFVGTVVGLNTADYPAPFQVPAINAEWTSIVQSQVGATRPEIFKCSQSDHWAFTYDDGPSPSTAVVLDALAARGQKATFFVIGSNVLQNTDMLKRIVQEGHQIGSHTWSHTALPSLSFGQIVSELVWTSKIIRDVTGVAPIIVRSPFGDTDEKVRQVASALNMTLVKWNRETNDWKFNAWTPGKTVDAPFKPSDTPDAIHQLFVDWTSQPKNGSISLQHDKSPEPVKQALPSIDTVMKAGYQFKTVADCIGQSAYSEVMLRRLNVSYQPAAAASIAKSGAMIAEPLSFSLLFAILALL